MRCMACDGEMILINVLQGGASTVTRFEQHTFRCSECHNEEQRLVFTKDGREVDPEPTEQVAPQVVPALTMQNDHLVASGTLSDPEEASRTVPLEPPQTMPPDPAQLGALQQTHMELPAAPGKTWARVLEKLGKRAAAASETERRLQFDHFWDSLRSKRPRDDPSSTSDA